MVIREEKCLKELSELICICDTLWYRDRIRQTLRIQLTDVRTVGPPFILTGRIDNDLQFA